MAISPLPAPANPLTAALGALGRPLGTGAAGGAGAAGAARPQPAARPAVGVARPAPAPLAQAAPALAAEAPAGTDPALWSVLTGDERAFFAKAAASGPLTYSRISAGVGALAGHAQGAAALAGAAAARGGRLDVRA